MTRQKLVVLSGAGISKESGIPTFRDNNGLWKQYRFEDVASPEAWGRNPALVLEFYNSRRKIVRNSKPNYAHIALVELERIFDVIIITQNVDDLHERAGSKNVLHLHSEIMKARSTDNPDIIIDIDSDELNIGDRCPLGSQLRPHIVWFGEPVPNIGKAVEIVQTADIFLVIGTGLQVYPAAGLIHYTPKNCKNFLIDPGTEFLLPENFVHIVSTAVEGMKVLIEKYLIRN